MKSKIPLDVQDQIVKMKAAGKKPKEIISLIKEEHKIKVAPSAVNYILYGKKGRGKKAKVSGQASVLSEDPQAVYEEIMSLIPELRNLYLNILKSIRGQLLNTLGKLREIKEREEEKG